MFKLRNCLTSCTFACALAVGLSALIVAAAPDVNRVAAVAPEVISIAKARALAAGASVTVEGSVTAPSGAFKSGTSDEGFAIQDKSGGIYVSTAQNLCIGLRQHVRVTGRLKDSYGLLALVPAVASDVKARGRGAKIQAESVATGRVGEASEGRLAQVTGTITKPVGNDLPYGYRLFIDDGSGEVQAFVYTSTSIDVSGFKPGQRIVVVGFSGQYNDHYEIIPRFQTDIRRMR
jgi:uncharacterized protein YdeI (BOF family)